MSYSVDVWFISLRKTGYGFMNENALHDKQNRNKYGGLPAERFLLSERTRTQTFKLKGNYQAAVVGN